MSNNEWTDWYGDGECPVADDDALFDVEFRCGISHIGGSCASGMEWGHTGSGGDIIRYRLHQSEQQAPQPKPGDALTLAQALRIVADNLDSGLTYGHGLEFIFKEDKWVHAAGHCLDLIVNKAKAGDLRLPPPRPRTVTIDGEVFEVPEPLRERPKHGDNYWYTEVKGEDIAAARWPWTGSLEDACKLRNGRAYATQADAEKRAAIERKIFGTTQGDEK